MVPTGVVVSVLRTPAITCKFAALFPGSVKLKAQTPATIFQPLMTRYTAVLFTHV